MEQKISVKNMPHVKEMHIINNSDNTQYTYLKSKKHHRKVFTELYKNPKVTTLVEGALKD